MAISDYTRGLTTALFSPELNLEHLAPPPPDWLYLPKGLNTVTFTLTPNPLIVLFLVPLQLLNEERENYPHTRAFYIHHCQKTCSETGHTLGEIRGRNGESQICQTKGTSQTMQLSRPSQAGSI